MKSRHLLFKTHDQVAPHGAQKVLGLFGGHGFSGTMKFFTETMHIPAPFALLAIAAESRPHCASVWFAHARSGVRHWHDDHRRRADGAFAVRLFHELDRAAEGRRFEYHILVVAIALALIIQGGGKWALDAVIHRKLTAGDTAPC